MEFEKLIGTAFENISAEIGHFEIEHKDWELELEEGAVKKISDCSEGRAGIFPETLSGGDG